MTDNTTGITFFQRSVTPQERRFLMAPTSHISLGLRIRGTLSEKLLRDAVKKMLITYPLFGVRIVWNDEVDRSTTEGAAEVPVLVYTRESEKSWLEVLNREHSYPIKLSAGPLTRIILVKGPAVSELFIFCHHAICDGRSLELALREILLHLGDADRTPPSLPDVPPQTPEIFPEGVSRSRIRSWFIERLNKKWQKERVLFDEEDLRNIWESFWLNSSYGVHLVTLDRHETQKFVEICRANDVTVNSALLIAFIKARSEALEPYEKKVKIGTAVDTRDRLPIEIGNAVGLYAGGISLKFEYKEDRPFWENVREYHKEVKRHLKNNDIFGPIYDQIALDPTLLDALLFAMIGDQVGPHQSRYQKISEFARCQKGLVAEYLEKFSSNIPDIMSTNLGKLDLPDEIDGIKIEQALFTPSAGLKMEIVLGAATAGGCLTVSLNYHDGYIDGERIERIHDKAEGLIKALLQ
ncbi:MAG: hypothetical protein HXS53_01960 [Theionarchaea archaeon]|nr:hypothetical protein [Theionarchaea archaeon]